MVMAAAQFADRHAVGKMFFADRRVVHQILLAIVDLSLQLFVTGIHPPALRRRALL